ncbi:MAG: IPT/TIG domain-containing protein [Mucilaginibacter sp.]
MNKKPFSCLPLYCCAVIIACFCACKKDRSPTPGKMPDITTVKDSLMDGGGVRLFGKLIPNDQVTDYGFEFGEDSLLQTHTTISLGKTIMANFTTDILEGLTTGHKYFFRAYEIVSATEKDGSILSFTSQGDKPIIITGTTPVSAGMGDTITVHGKYFDIKKSNVFFDNAQAKTLSITDSTIVCVIPYLTFKYNNGLSVMDNDNSRSTYRNFSLAAPVITSFTDKKFIGDTVEIDGDNFDKVPNPYTEVDFGTAKVQIISMSRKKLLVVVPTLYNTPVPIKVVGQFQSVTSSSQFSLALPTITAAPSSTGTLNLITITGNNFFPSFEYDYNQVFVNGVKANLFAADPHSIKLQVPEAPYPARTANISVNVLAQTANYNGTLSITDKWLMMGNNLPFVGYVLNQAFVINNQAYCLSQGNYVYKYDETANTWAQYQQLSSSYFIAALTVVGNKAYLYDSSTNSMLQYDPAAKQITPGATFPGLARTEPAMFSINNIVYMGLGADVGIYSDFYSYNPATNTWKKQANIGSDPEYDSITGFFVIGTKGYVFYSASAGNSMQAYDPQTDTWTKKASFPANGLATGFALNNKGYACGATVDNFTDNCFQYDPVSDTWTKKANVGFQTHVNISFSFVLGTNAYIGITDNNRTTSIVYRATASDLQ